MAKKYDKELLDIEKYPNPATCVSQLHLIWASRDSSLCQTPAQQVVLDALIKIGNFDEKTGTFIAGHPIYGLSAERLAKVTRMSDKHGHRQLNRVIDQLRDEPSKLGKKSSEAKRRKANLPEKPDQDVKRLNLIHVVEREGQANRYIVHAQVIYKDAQKNLKENKDEWAAKEQAELEAIARFGAEAPDDTPVSDAEQKVLDDLGPKAEEATAQPSTPSAVGLDTWQQAVTECRDRLYVETGRSLPKPDSTGDVASFNALANLVNSLPAESALEKVKLAVEFALVTKPWWRDKRLAADKVPCPAAAFAKYFPTINTQAEEKAAKLFRKNRTTPAATKTVPQPQQAANKSSLKPWDAKAWQQRYDEAQAAEDAAYEDQDINALDRAQRRKDELQLEYAAAQGNTDPQEGEDNNGAD